jgi:SAM-dependent methyltransferase
VPASLRSLKVLDPACGSGHFLVIAFGLLFALYQEEARHRGQASTPREIVESILEHNLHGIDIDPKAVQIAAAALMLKARQLCADAEPRVMNLVAPALSLAASPMATRRCASCTLRCRPRPASRPNSPRAS